MEADLDPVFPPSRIARTNSSGYSPRRTPVSLFASVDECSCSRMATADNSLASPAETSSAADVVIDVSGSGFASIQDEWVAERGASRCERAVPHVQRDREDREAGRANVAAESQPARQPHRGWDRSLSWQKNKTAHSRTMGKGDGGEDGVKAKARKGRDKSRRTYELNGKNSAKHEPDLGAFASPFVNPEEDQDPHPPSQTQTA